MKLDILLALELPLGPLCFARDGGTGISKLARALSFRYSLIWTKQIEGEDLEIMMMKRGSIDAPWLHVNQILSCNVRNRGKVCMAYSNNLAFLKFIINQNHINTRKVLNWSSYHKIFGTKSAAPVSCLRRGQVLAVTDHVIISSVLLNTSHVHWEHIGFSPQFNFVFLLVKGKMEYLVAVTWTKEGGRRH